MLNWSERSACAARVGCMANVVASINSVIFSYFSPRRGWPRVVKICVCTIRVKLDEKWRFFWGGICFYFFWKIRRHRSEDPPWCAPVFNSIITFLGGGATSTTGPVFTADWLCDYIFRWGSHLYNRSCVYSWLAMRLHFHQIKTLCLSSIISNVSPIVNHCLFVPTPMWQFWISFNGRTKNKQLTFKDTSLYAIVFGLDFDYVTKTWRGGGRGAGGNFFLGESSFVL